MVTRDSDGKILLFARPDAVERPPFPVYAGHWTLTTGHLATFTISRTETGVEIRHDCGQMVTVINDADQLADVIADITDHVCGREATP